MAALQKKKNPKIAMDYKTGRSLIKSARKTGRKGKS
jgi:hypothetical protein